MNLVGYATNCSLPETLGEAIQDSWLLTLPEAIKQRLKRYSSKLKALINDLLDQVLDFHKRNPVEFVSTVEPNLWRSVLNIFDGFLKEYIVQDGKTILPECLMC
jgi:hypothetical protein